MKQTKTKVDVKLFYRLAKQPAQISHNFLLQGRGIIIYCPQSGRNGGIGYILYADALDGFLDENSTIFYLEKSEAERIIFPFENALKLPVSYSKMHEIAPDILDCPSINIYKGVNNLMKFVFEDKER